jgi:hypothetical protein
MTLLRQWKRDLFGKKFALQKAASFFRDLCESVVPSSVILREGEQRMTDFKEKLPQKSLSA